MPGLSVSKPRMSVDNPKSTNTLRNVLGSLHESSQIDLGRIFNSRDINNLFAGWIVKGGHPRAKQHLHHGVRAVQGWPP